MIASLGKAIRQLPDPEFRRVLLISLAGTLMIYLLLYIGAGFGLEKLALFDITWLNSVVHIAGTIGLFAVTLFLFPSVATLVLSFLLDDIATAVEHRHYPTLKEPRAQPLRELFWGSLRFSGMAILINLVALPFYLLFALAGIGVILFYLVNGSLLAREYFELAAWRRLDPKAAEKLRQAHRGRLLLMGMIITFLSSVPIVNLIAPLIGTAAMVHEVEALRQLPETV